MKILVACEFSGIVREAFAKRGHEAWSCDYRPTDRLGNHFQGTILNHQILKNGWDLMIAHPDCTFLTVSGAAWFHLKWREMAQKSAEYFVRSLWEFPINKIALENPIGILSTVWRKPSQIIHPWQFGHREEKSTCLWLKNLPKLIPTKIVELPKLSGTSRRSLNRLDSLPPSPERQKLRSTTYQGIADAMAEQWGAA